MFRGEGLAGALGLVAALACVAPRPAATGRVEGEARAAGEGREADRAAIRAIHERVRQAHFERDAAAFLASHADSWLDVRDGAVERATRAAVQPGLAEYLRGMRFLEVSDASDPVIEVSGDGTMAWLVGEVRVRAMQVQPDGTERPIAFRAAWLSAYAKRGNVWVQVATANTMRDGA